MIDHLRTYSSWGGVQWDGVVRGAPETQASAAAYKYNKAKLVPVKEFA